MESKKTRTVSLLVLLIDRNYKVVKRSSGYLFPSARDCLSKWMPNVKAGAPILRFHVCLIQSIPTNHAKMCWQSLLPVFTSPSSWSFSASILCRDKHTACRAHPSLCNIQTECYGDLLDVHGRHSGTKCIDKSMVIESSLPDTSDTMVCSAMLTETSLSSAAKSQYAKYASYAIRNTHLQRLSSLGNLVSSLADLQNQSAAR